jgi:hypothetical protein
MPFFEQLIRPVLCAALLGGSVAEAARAPAPTGTSCPTGLKVTIRDSLDERIELGAPLQQFVTIVLVTDPSAQDKTTTLFRELDERLLNAPVETVGIVDLRRYAGIARRWVEWRLRKAAGEARAARRTRRERRGVDASAPFVDRWHLVGDFSGELLARFGGHGALPAAFVVDRCGTVRGPLRDATAVLAALAQLLPSSTSANRAAPPALSRSHAAR